MGRKSQTGKEKVRLEEKSDWKRVLRLEDKIRMEKKSDWRNKVRPEWQSHTGNEIIRVGTKKSD